MNNNNKRTAPSWAKRLNQIQVRVFENDDKRGHRTFCNTSCVRRYQVGEEWRESNQLTGEADVVLAIEALRQALEFVRAHEASHRVSDSDAE